MKHDFRMSDKDFERWHRADNLMALCKVGFCILVVIILFVISENIK